MACIHLAGKVEDDPTSMRKIILCYTHLYRKRRRNSNNAQQSNNDNEELKTFPPISPFGRVYKEWKDIIIQMESIILRTLGFVFYWIPDNHPHKFILYFVHAIYCSSDGDGDNKEKEQLLAQTAWNYCNDSCFFDICVRYEPEVTACAAIYLSAKNNNINLPFLINQEQKKIPWYEILIGANKEQCISNICNALLFLQNNNTDDENNTSLTIMQAAFINFIPSLLSNDIDGNGFDDGSFNDPGSFIWLWMDEFEMSLQS